MKELFYGGKILTMAQPQYAEAMLTENGKILAVGSREALERQAPDCEKTDLRGGVLMPGFIDPHSHFFQVAASLLQVSVDGAASPEEMEKRILAFIEENQIQPGQWVNARDYDNNEMPGLKNPTPEQLNRFAPRNPLVIHHKSGHMGLMNTLALEQLGITPETQAPEGGRIGKEDGKLTGYLEENAFFEYLKKIPMAGPEQLLRAFDGAQKQYASYGITTVQDGMVVDQMLPMYELLLQQKKLCLDVYLYTAPESRENAQALLQRHPENTCLHLGGLKIFLDGSPQGRTAWMRSPYQGEKEYCGYPTMTDEAVEAAFEQAALQNTQLICHCNGDAAAEQFLRCLEKTEQKYPRLRGLRPVIIHGQLMGRDQVARAARLGAMISFFVAHVYHWGDVHIRNFGMERASGISPARSAMDAGVNVTFHQDAPVIQPDMLETLWCARQRITKNGVRLGKEECISPLEALEAVTVNAARQYAVSDRMGTLEPGKDADLVLLDGDPLETEDPRTLRVLRTYKRGVCIYKA